MKSYCYKPGGDGKGKEGDIPTPFEEAAKQAHEELVEMIAEGNDELLEEFFETGTLPVEHIVSGLQQAVKDRRIFPILCASGLQNVGTDCLLNFICEIIARAGDDAKRCAGLPRSSSRPLPIRLPDASLTSR